LVERSDPETTANRAVPIDVLPCAGVASEGPEIRASGRKRRQRDRRGIRGARSGRERAALEISFKADDQPRI
jgi:hypothetical protein